MWTGGLEPLFIQKVTREISNTVLEMTIKLVQVCKRCSVKDKEAHDRNKMYQIRERSGVFLSSLKLHIFVISIVLLY